MTLALAAAGASVGRLGHRTIIGAATTQSGDIINFKSLLGCSTITLTSGEIVVPQNDLFLNGPRSDALMIDGGSMHRVMHHSGTGTLSITGLTLTHGKYTSSAIASGGCLVSTGNVTEERSSAGDASLGIVESRPMSAIRGV